MHGAGSRAAHASDGASCWAAPSETVRPASIRLYPNEIAKRLVTERGKEVLTPWPSREVEGGLPHSGPISRAVEVSDHTQVSAIGLGRHLERGTPRARRADIGCPVGHLLANKQASVCSTGDPLDKSTTTLLSNELPA